MEMKEDFNDVNELAQYIRNLNANVTLIYAFNGIGKTRLSQAIKNYYKNCNDNNNENNDDECNNNSIETVADTLYYNSFTEDLFFWDNNKEDNQEYYLKYKHNSKFINGIIGDSIESDIKEFFHKFSNINFKIDTTTGTISFETKNSEGETITNIKISRAEESLFILCFFLTILKKTIDYNPDKQLNNTNDEKITQENNPYEWIKYIVIDDPVSSLDDNNIVSIAVMIYDLIGKNCKFKVIISTHHILFFNILHNRFRDKNKNKDEDKNIDNNKNYIENKFQKYSLSYKDNKFILKKQDKDTPSFYHIELLQYLKKTYKENNLHSYHFNMLRILLEKLASFLGYDNFTNCLPQEDELKNTYTMLLQSSSHGGYSHFEPKKLHPDNVKHFYNILTHLIKTYKFNIKLGEKDE